MTSIIQRTYQAASGEEVTASDETVKAVLEALGLPDEDPWQQMLEPVIVAWEGALPRIAIRVSASDVRRRIEYDIELEDGDVISGNIPASCRRQVRESAAGRMRKIELSCLVNVQLPPGYHQLRLRTASGEASALLLAAPKKAYSGDRPREWGVFAPLYSLRATKTQAIGDFGNLEDLMRWTAERNGDLVATLPISAAFLRQPFDPSPYSPASRLFWNELYLRTEQRPTTRKTDLVDYRAAAEAKRALVEPVAEEFFADGADKSKQFREFLKLYPDAQRYAQFRAVGEKQESGWPAWPARLRDGTIRPSDYDAAAMQYHLYAQFAAHQQLTSLARNAREVGVRLYLDMPLGVHPDSYDVWQNRDLFVMNTSAGAPPDPFFTRGQNWGFPPPHPVNIRKDQYRYWRKVLQTQLRYAGILRLDHVMALHRLYLVPNGNEATQGAYVRYPAEELYAALTIESVRHQAAIVGEDLGTVPPEVRKAMDAHGVKRMFVVQFEATDDARAPMGEVPAGAVASLNTHDMPPFKAYWESHDAELRRDLGLIDDEGVTEANRLRTRTGFALSRMVGAKERLDAGAALTELLAYLAKSPADIVLLNLEDIWLENEPQNVPGTSHERPNWRRRLKYTLSEINNDSAVRETLNMVEECRRS